MTFFDAITTVFRKYAEFSGRATRPEFWWFALFSALVSTALNTLNIHTSSNPMVAMSPTATGFYFGSSLAAFWSVAVLLPSLAVTIRRLRDAGREWTEIFWILLPIAGAIVLIVHLCDPTQPAEAATPAATPATPAT